MEAPADNGATISMSLADLYDMTGKPYPTKPGPNGNPITPPGFFKKKDMSVGPGGIDQELANAHKQWVDGGKLPGVLLDKDGELKPYNTNSTLEDLSWAFIGGGAELLNSWIKGAAVPIDDFINNFTMSGIIHKKATGENLSNLKTSTLSGYDKIDEKFWGDEVVEWFNNKTDQAFRDNVAWTSGAVNNFNDVRDLFYGHTGFNLEGAAGIMIGELPSEIVDLGVIMATGPLAGMAATGVLNALEAGGAAAQSITDRINNAYKKGVLQNSPQYKLYLDAAMMQLQADDVVRKPAELIEEAQDLARKHAIDMSIRNAFYKVAVTGGVIDAVQNRILYSGGKISSNFLKNAVLKGAAGTAGEGVSGYLEQVFENTGIIKGAGGNITTAREGAFNAAYNEMLAAQSGNVLATTVDGASRARAGLARFSQFIMGGRRDPKAILDIMSMDSNTLINRIETVDPETGVRKFALAEMIKKRLLTEDQLTKGELRQLSRNGSFTRDGVRYTRKQIKENTDNIQLISLLDDVEINVEENTSTINLDDEGQARRLAQLLGITVDNEKVTDKTDINKVLAQLENVRKIDVRIEGRSTLEPPIWSDLDDMQKMEYWKDGKVTFTNHPERGNQTWTRQQIMFNSRRMEDNVPDEVANLLDNAPKRVNMEDPTSGPSVADAVNAKKLMDQLTEGARRKLEDDQTAWDNRNQKSIADGDGPLDPDTRPTEENNEDFKRFFNSSLYTAQKANYERALKEIKEDQKAWDSEYGLTHNFDGSPKKGSQIFAEKQRFDAKAEQLKKEQERKENALNTVKENEGVTDFDAPEAPHVPVIKGGDAESDKKVDISRKHYIAHAKIKIANGEMQADELEAFLEASDKVYPGSSKEIISDEDRANYQSIDLRPEVKDNVVKDFEKPTENVANTRPPEGAEVTFQGKKYVWLGVADGKGGMWAEVKEDGSRGRTDHKFHKDLMATYQNQNISADRDDSTKTNYEDNQPDPGIIQRIKDYFANLGKEVRDATIDSEKEETSFLVEPPRAGDEKYVDTKIPTNVENEFREVLKTNNAIKVQNFLNSLPPEQAGAFRLNPQKYQSAPVEVKPSSASTKTTSTTSTTSTSTTTPRTTTTTSGGPAGGAVTQMKVLNQAVANIQNVDPRFSQPQLKSALEQYLKNNPNIAQQAANDNRAPSNIKSSGIAKQISKTVLGRVLGPVAMILSPTTVGDGTISDSQQAANEFYQDLLKNNPVALKNLFDAEMENMTGAEKNDFKTDPQYQAVEKRVKELQNDIAKKNQDAQQQAAGPQTGFPDAPINLGRGTPETPEQSRERVAAYQKRQAELDAQEKAKVKSDDLTGIEEPGANQPIQFTPTDQLTQQQKAELDKIARDNQKQADDAMGRTAKTKDTGTQDAGAEVKDKAQDNTAAYNQQQQDKEAGQANYADQDQLQKGNIELNPADAAALGVTSNLNKQNQQNKNQNKKSNLNTKLKNKTKQKVDKTGVMRKGPRFGFLGGDDDGTDDSSLMKFYPAKYQDPLDLEKYKGAIGRAQSALPTGGQKQ